MTTYLYWNKHNGSNKFITAIDAELLTQADEIFKQQINADPARNPNLVVTLSKPPHMQNVANLPDLYAHVARIMDLDNFPSTIETIRENWNRDKFVQPWLDYGNQNPKIVQNYADVPVETIEHELLQGVLNVFVLNGLAIEKRNHPGEYLLTTYGKDWYKQRILTGSLT